MSERSRGLIDTSVAIDLDVIARHRLPEAFTVAAITLAELTSGVLAVRDDAERARRQDKLQRLEALIDPLPFDDRAARAYGRIYAAVLSIGRKAPGRRVMDLLIASTALANGLPLYTRDASDFQGFSDLIDVVAV